MLRPAAHQDLHADSTLPRQLHLRRHAKSFRLWSRRTAFLALTVLVLGSLVTSVSHQHRMVQSVNNSSTVFGRSLAPQTTRLPVGVAEVHRRENCGDNTYQDRPYQASRTYQDRLMDQNDDQEAIMNNFTNLNTLLPSGAFSRRKSKLTLNVVPERWPSGMEMRRKRRYSHIPEAVAVPPLLLNSLECPNHRARSPYGFLPATGRPIDSTILVQSSTSSISEGCSDVDIVKAMMSRQDIDDSQYFTFLPLSSAPTENGMSRRAVECEKSRREELQVDLVYTYVNGSAYSLQQALSQVGLPYDPHRYRDWDELRYSLRSVYYRAVCLPGSGAFGPRDKDTNDMPTCVEGTFIRRIYIVVADEDQVPIWLNTTHPLFRVVTHREIFPSIPDPKRRGRRVFPHLPTFNSHAIELQLHRIPGLSRFYIYFNNDMILGRRLSLLDYFRPLSDARREIRRSSSGKTVGGCSSSGIQDACAVFEPIIYGEAMSRGCAPRRRKGAASQLLEALSQDRAQSTSPTCRQHFIRPSFLYDLECFYPSRRSYETEPMLRKMNFNQRLAFDRLDGVSVVHSFPHFPQLFDRLLVERMVETDFADVAENTRLQRMRTDNDLFVTMLYSTYAIAHRMAVETVLRSSEQVHESEGGESGWFPQEWMEWATASPPLGLNVPFDDATIHQHLGSLGHNFFATDTWMPASWQFGTSSADSTRAAIRDLTAAFNASWMSSDALLACSKRRNCTSILKEKCRRHIVYFFDKLSSYRFCQLLDHRNAKQCLKDVFSSSSGTGTRLFWTLNDDWGLPRPGARRRNVNGTVASALRARAYKSAHDEKGQTSAARRMFSTKRTEADGNPMTRSIVRKHRRAQQWSEDGGGPYQRPSDDGVTYRKVPHSAPPTVLDDTPRVMQRLLRAITRDVGAAPWELQQEDSAVTLEPLEQGDDERYGPTTLVDYRSRRDMHSFLRREWITDRKRPKDEWLRNLLD